MEIQLQDLIEQIKKDGVAEADAQANAIVENAKKEADRIIENAKIEADKIRVQGRADSERFARVSEDAVRQAGRNVLISFRESVARELTAITSQKVTALFEIKTLERLVIAVAEALAKNDEVDDISILVNQEDITSLKDGLLAELKEKINKGVTLQPSDNFKGGFRIAVNQGVAYYDFSAAAVVEMLSTYLSPQVVALLKEAENV